MRKHLLGAAAALALLSACAAARPAPAAPRYDLSLSVRPEAHRLEVAGTVALPAAREPRAELRFSLLDVMRDLAVEVVEPRESAGPAKVGRDGPARVVTPARPLPAGAPVVLRVSYAGETPAPVGIFYVGPEGSFASGTNVPWYPQFDYARGTGRLRFSLPEGYAAHASGGRRGDAHAFEAAAPVHFSFGVGRYSVYRRAGATPVSAHLLRPRADAEEYLEGCARVLEVLGREFGEYPHAEFAVVEVPQGPADRAGYAGASVDGLIFVSTYYVEAGFNLPYYGHEIGHQWWGNSVGVEGRLGGYVLSEGMAQYGSLRAVEELEGAAAAERYRRTGYPGYIFDQNALGYLTLAAAGLDHRLVDLPNNWVSHQLANSKGFLALDALSREVGRERFSRALRGLTRRHANGRVRWEEFRAAVERAAGRDLGWFFAQWFEREGAPDWRLEWSQAGGCGEVKGVITQTEPFYRARLGVEAEGEGGRRFAQSFEVTGARTEARLRPGFCVTRVTLDPRYEVLRWTPEYRAEAAALAPFQRGYRRLQESKALAREIFREALKDAPAEDPHGLRFMLEYGMAAAYALQGRWAEARARAEAALAAPPPRPERVAAVYLLLAEAAEALRDRELLDRALKGASAADEAAGVRSGAARAVRAIRDRVAAEGFRGRAGEPAPPAPPPGPPSLKGNTTFVLKGFEDARSVVLAGAFNNWSTTATPCGREPGGWVCRVDLAPGRHAYKFVVDGEWITDPANPLAEDDGAGNVNSVRVVKR